MKGSEKERIISFTSIHLTAIFWNAKRRVAELQSLQQQLEKYQEIVDLHIFQGDLNFHSEEENSCFSDLNLKDYWLEKYDLK